MEVLSSNLSAGSGSTLLPSSKSQCGLWFYSFALDSLSVRARSTLLPSSKSQCGLGFYSFALVQISVRALVLAPKRHHLSVSQYE
jgi:hypothetical protein